MKRIFVAEPMLNGNERQYITRCLDDNRLTMGAYVAEFERSFALRIGVKHAISCMNGTTALHLALLALDLQPGDEVLIPTLTYVATANAVAYCGATPVLCDVELGTWTISHDEILRKKTSKTVGIIPVHLYGQPADMNAINATAQHYGWWVLEDAAEALGGIYRQRPVGALGSAAMFSFYGNKIITCGEGGMVTTNDDRLASKARLLRGQGMSPVVRYYHPEIGYNYRMTELQGAIGLGQLENLRWHQDRRKEIWHQYTHWFLESGVEFQMTFTHVQHAHWMFTVMVPPGRDRDFIMKSLDADGIETRPTFVPMHRLPMYASNDKFPVSDDVARRGINLPTHARLTQQDIQRVCTSVYLAMQS